MTSCFCAAPSAAAQVVKEAEAEAEAKFLQGVGVARQRQVGGALVPLAVLKLQNSRQYYYTPLVASSQAGKRGRHSWLFQF
jgi:hypothetical protein